MEVLDDIPPRLITLHDQGSEEMIPARELPRVTHETACRQRMAVAMQMANDHVKDFWGNIAVWKQNELWGGHVDNGMNLLKTGNRALRVEFLCNR